MSKNGVRNLDWQPAQTKPSAIHRLYVSVISRAIIDACYVGTSQRSIKDRRDARDWFQKGGPGFVMCCEIIGLDPCAVQQSYLSGRLNADVLKNALNHYTNQPKVAA